MIETLDYKKATIRMYADSITEKTKRIVACEKETETVDFIERMRPLSIFFDIGANTGAYSLIAASRGLRVTAFEPAYFNFKRLCENVALNELNGILCLPYLLSNHTGFKRLEYSSTEVGAALHETRQLEESGQAMISWRLDDLVAVAGLPEPNYVKVDVDGHDLEILLGARRTLQKCKALQVELDSSKDQQEIVEFLYARGFRLTHLTPHGSTSISNGLFTR